MGKKSRNKGKRGELELSHFLTDHGFPAQRGQQFKGGKDSPDVDCPSFPFPIECKRTEALSAYKALDQCQADAGRAGVVFHRRNNRHWIAILDAELLLEVLSAKS